MSLYVFWILSCCYYYSEKINIEIIFFYKKFCSIEALYKLFVYFILLYVLSYAIFFVCYLIRYKEKPKCSHFLTSYTLIPMFSFCIYGLSVVLSISCIYTDAFFENKFHPDNKLENNFFFISMMLLCLLFSIVGKFCCKYELVFPKKSEQKVIPKDHTPAPEDEPPHKGRQKSESLSQDTQT